MAIELPTIAEAKRVLHADRLEHTARTVVAANALMEVCEHNHEVDLQDMLRCLDYGGTIAEIGARCLYVRTGRDGLGWEPAGANGKLFVTDRTDWERYLHEHSPTSDT